MRTTLPPKFVLAWPEWTGHKYLHYHCMVVNQDARSVSRIQNGYNKQPFHSPVETRYDEAVIGSHPININNELRCQLTLLGVHNFKDWSKAAGLWAIRASQTGVKALNFVTNGKFYEHGVEVPVRFEAIRANYFTGEMEYRETARPIPRIFYKWDDRRWDWKEPPPNEDWEKLLDACEKEWRELSHSQFVFVSKLPYDRIQLRGTWRQRVRSVLEFNGRDRSFLGTLKTAIGVERKPHGSIVQTVIKRCVKRFIARHPTRATTRLLQLLGAASAFKKSA